MGPQASRSYPGRQLVRPAGPKAERARREIDHGRRGVAGYVLGALQPATGAAFTPTCERRTTVNRVDFLGAVGAWIDPAVERVRAVPDNLNIHRAPDVLLFSLLHPRREFVFQPQYAACPNLIEPWWKVLRSADAQSSPLRGLGRDRGGGQASHGLLERAPPPLRPGPPTPSSAAPPPRHRRRPKSLPDLADEPIAPLWQVGRGLGRVEPPLAVRATNGR